MNRTVLIVPKNLETSGSCLPLPLATIPSIDWMKKHNRKQRRSPRMMKHPIPSIDWMKKHQRKHRRRWTMMKHPNQKYFGWKRSQYRNFDGSFQLKTHPNFKTLFWLIHICALDIKNIARTSLWALRYKNTSKLAQGHNQHLSRLVYSRYLCSHYKLYIKYDKRQTNLNNN